MLEFAPFFSGLSPFLGPEQASSQCVRKTRLCDYFVPLPKEATLTRGDVPGFANGFLMLAQPASSDSSPAQGQALMAARKFLPAPDLEILLYKLGELKAVFSGAICLEYDFSSIL